MSSRSCPLYWYNERRHRKVCICIHSRLEEKKGKKLVKKKNVTTEMNEKWGKRRERMKEMDDEKIRLHYDCVCVCELDCDGNERKERGGKERNREKR